MRLGSSILRRYERRGSRQGPGYSRGNCQEPHGAWSNANKRRSERNGLKEAKGFMVPSDKLLDSFESIRREALAVGRDPNSVVEIIHNRRARQRRRSHITAGVCTLLLLLTVGTIVRVGGLNQGSTSSLDPTGTSSAQVGNRLEERVFNLKSWQSGPAQAEPNRPYPLDLNVHCGLQYVVFAGQNWKTNQALPAEWTKRNDGQSVIPGYATLLDASSLRFDAPGYLNNPIMFQKTSQQFPGCA